MQQLSKIMVLNIDKIDELKFAIKLHPHKSNFVSVIN